MKIWFRGGRAASVARGLLLLGATWQASGAAAAGMDEFKVKREADFAFAQKPLVTRQGDLTTIEFEAAGLCDATVAIENARGVIIRHLASGVLGTNAPAPFRQGSKRQRLVWDGKNDQGVYVDDQQLHTVRVSLGLKPEFERTLFWCPQKRVGNANSPLLCAAPEGVYIAEGCGLDSLRLYDHGGDYLRTLYPFPRGKLDQVKGMELGEFPQDGQKLPLKYGPKHRSTLLRSGDNMVPSPGKYGAAGNALAAQGNRLALAYHALSRLAGDGTTGGLELHGPPTAIDIMEHGKPKRFAPRSAAFSPDGRWLYLTGYNSGGEGCEWLHCVTRLDFANGKELELFAGTWKGEDRNAADKDLKVPTGVAVDRQGRVYVADFMNSRIQVYAPDGKVLKSVKTPHPAEVAVHPGTGEIYVGSWMLKNRFVTDIKYAVPATFTRLGPLDSPVPKATYPLPFNSYNATVSWNRTSGLQYRMTVDFWSEQPTIWIVPGVLFDIGGWAVVSAKQQLAGTGILLLREEQGALVIKRDFDRDTTAAVVRANPPVIARQRLYVHPVSGKLYVAEGDGGVMKSFKQLVEIEPRDGRIRLVNLPMASEDMAIGLDGLFYLRSDFEVARYDPTTWREVPWDYGEERKGVGFDAPTTNLKSALRMPGTGRYPCWWHMGGMAINAKGELAVVTCNFNKPPAMRSDENPYAKSGAKITGGIPYMPALYPGRAIGYETHVWDRRGKLLCEDALPGFSTSDGLGLDKDGNLYVLAAMNRMLGDKPYFLPWAATLVKMPPKQGRVVCSADSVPVPVHKDQRPDRQPDAVMWGFGPAWVENAAWLYGGVGFVGGASGGSCVCWNARPALDLFARSFAPEVDHYSVAALDSNGNLILRIGQYGNVDDGMPLRAAAAPAPGRATAAGREPPTQRSIGGDEVAIFHAPYLGTHTDRRLFIADPGNQRILSVRLGYHADETVALKDIPDTAR